MYPMILEKTETARKRAALISYAWEQYHLDTLDIDQTLNLIVSINRLDSLKVYNLFKIMLDKVATSCIIYPYTNTTGDNTMKFEISQETISAALHYDWNVFNTHIANGELQKAIHTSDRMNEVLHGMRCAVLWGLPHRNTSDYTPGQAAILDDIRYLQGHLRERKWMD